MSMSRRLILHIGHPKTGTTSIQTFLVTHRTALERHGVYVPRSGWIEGAHHGLAENYFSVRRLPSQTSDHLFALERELTETQAPTVVLSSEAFIQENPARLAALFRPRFDVFIVYYVRRQDLAAQSVYAQRVRSEIQRECGTISEKLYHFVPRYRLHLDRFAAVFGTDHCLLRPFETSAFVGGTLIGDFLSLLGLSSDLLPFPDARRNTALQRPYLAFRRQTNILPLLNEEHQALGRALDSLSQADPTPWPRHLLSAEERLAILHLCAEENAWLARTYRGSTDGTLFRDPLPSPDEPWAPLGSLEPDLQHRILDALPAEIRELLEFLDRKIRLRQPGQPFLPEWPSDQMLQQRLLDQRELTILQRRIARLELAQAQPTPTPSHPSPFWKEGWKRLKGRARRFLRR